MKLSLFTVFLVLISSLTLLAQEELENYNQGKQMVVNGNFGQAMDLLSPYLDYDSYGEVANYAAYHYAKAAYGDRQYVMAQNALKQVIRTRDWKHQDDARYLLALCYFQQKNLSDALAEVAGIQDEAILEAAYRASYQFLRPISSSVLIVNLPNYKSNQGLVMALRDQLASRSILSSGEQEVYDSIKNLDFSKTAETSDISRELNQTLEVAVVLPFNYTGGSGVKQLGDNNFVFEFYQGIKLAVEEAKAQGISLTIRTFDTERKTEVVNKILEDPFFQLADIIVGPIYPVESDIVAQYAESRKIPFINPLSNIGDDSKKLEFAYLFRPSIQSINEGILEYSKKLPGKRIAVAYSGTARDEMLAKQYSESVQKLGYQIVANTQVTARDMRGFFENLSVQSGETPKADQIVIFSDDPNIASPTFAIVESLSFDIPVLVMDSWLYFNFASYETLNIQNFHFIGNNTVDFSKEEVALFRESFFEKYKVYPGVNAHLGYEIIYWVSNVINSQKGFDFQENLNQAGFINGKLTYGFDFTENNSNKFVPILRLKEGIFEVE